LWESEGQKGAVRAGEEEEEEEEEEAEEEESRRRKVSGHLTHLPPLPAAFQ